MNATEAEVDAKALRVKPLTWTHNDPATAANEAWFGSGACNYRALITRNELNKGWDWYGSLYLTIEAAKAAAQADYVRRILDAIEPPAASGEAAKSETARRIEEVVTDLCWVNWPSAKDGRFQRRTLNREGIENTATFILALGRKIAELEAALSTLQVQTSEALTIWRWREKGDTRPWKYTDVAPTEDDKHWNDTHEIEVYRIARSPQ